MKTSILEGHIKSSYDDTMKDYLESPAQRQADIEWNKWYFSFRKKIDAEDRQEFDDLMRAFQDMLRLEAEEALYRGTITGIAERDKILGYC